MIRAEAHAGIAGAMLLATASLAGSDGRAATRSPTPARAEAKPVGGAAPASTSTLATARVDWTAGGCPVWSESPPEPIGRSPDQLARTYGPTKSDVRFILGEAMDPVSMALRNVLSAPADLRREVREQGWERAGCELRVWSVVRNGAWIAFASDLAPAGGENCGG